MEQSRRLKFIARISELQGALTSALNILLNPEYQELFSRDYQFRDTGDTFEVLAVEGAHHFIFAKHRGGAFPRLDQPPQGTFERALAGHCDPDPSTHSNNPAHSCAEPCAEHSRLADPEC